MKTCVLTAGGSFYFLVVDLVDGTALVPGWLSQGIQCLGIIWQILAKLYLGREFGLLPREPRYRRLWAVHLVRHPIYFGYLIAHVGYLLSAFSLRNVLVYVLLYMLQIGRILEEEKVLSRSDTYREYRARVRFKLVPGVF